MAWKKLEIELTRTLNYVLGLAAPRPPGTGNRVKFVWGLAGVPLKYVVLRSESCLVGHSLALLSILPFSEEDLVVMGGQTV